MDSVSYLDRDLMFPVTAIVVLNHEWRFTCKWRYSPLTTRKYLTVIYNIIYLCYSIILFNVGIIYLYLWPHECVIRGALVACHYKSPINIK